MTGKRKQYSAEFKARVALEEIRGEQMVAQLAARHCLHQTLISGWKKQAVGGMAGIFSGKTEAVGTAREGEIGQLHAKIGQLVVERDFLRRASGRLMSGGGGKWSCGAIPACLSCSNARLLGSAARRFTAGRGSETMKPSR